MPLVEDAYVTLNDPTHSAFWRQGQFELPFGAPGAFADGGVPDFKELRLRRDSRSATRASKIASVSCKVTITASRVATAV